MNELLNPNDTFMLFLQLVVLVLLLLRGIWWVEDRIKAGQERERKMVERKTMSPEQLAEYEAELDRWLYEGRG